MRHLFLLLFFSCSVPLIQAQETQEDETVLDDLKDAGSKVKIKLLKEDIKQLETDEQAANELLLAQESGDAKLGMLDEERLRIELETYQLKKEKKSLLLQKAEAQLNGQALSADEKNAYEQRCVEIDGCLKELKIYDEKLANEQRLESGSKLELQAKKAELLTNLKTIESQLFLMGKSMKPSKRYRLEAEVRALKKEIERYNSRLAEL